MWRNIFDSHRWGLDNVVFGRHGFFALMGMGSRVSPPESLDQQTASAQASSATRTISVVFPAHNNLEQLRLTLPAIAKQQVPNHAQVEVIVVDDGSGPETADWLAALDMPGVRVLRLPQNLGRSGARNAGVKASSADIVVFLDSDVLVGSGFLASHLEALERGDGNSASSSGRPRMSLGLVVDTESLETANANYSSGQAGIGARLGFAHFTTANVALPRQLLLDVAENGRGPFDAETFTEYGWEDLELERRLLRFNPTRVRNDAAIGFHHSPPFGLEQLPRMIQKEAERARMARRFFAKHPAFAVRLMIQATPLHRALWELLSLGGLLNARTMTPLLRWLVARQRTQLAASLARLTILNPAYMRAL